MNVRLRDVQTDIQHAPNPQQVHYRVKFVNEQSKTNFVFRCDGAKQQCRHDRLCLQTYCTVNE